MKMNFLMLLPAVLTVGSTLAQVRIAVNIPGTLELVDKPPAATPVEFLDVAVQALGGGQQFRAKPDSDGRFTLKDVLPGRYALLLGFPGRIRVFETGVISLRPDDILFAAGQSGPLHLVVSLKTSDLSVDVTGIPENHNVVALLSPADPYLTLRGSSFLNRISGHHTQFRFTPPGTYRLFIVDSEFQKDLAFSASVRNALEHQATAIQMREDGETKITATYIAAEIVKQAVSHAGDAIPDRAENHAIRSRGRLEIPQTWEWDLDDGVVGHMGQPDAAPLDLWYEAVNSDLRYIVPTNNALLSVVGQESVGYAGCASARLSPTRIALDKFKKGTFVCVRTGEDRYSEFSIEDLFAPNAEKPNVLTLVIEYKTWER